MDCTESPRTKEGPTIIVAELEDVGQALALADCAPLYTNDVDTQKKIRCTGQCSRTWIPVTVEKGDSVTTQTPGPVSPVTILKRPDGRRQAALEGKPLYTYTRESETGASGDGVTDSFGGTEFSWSVITPDEAAPEPGQAAVPAPGQGLGGGQPPGQEPAAPPQSGPGRAPPP